MRQLTGQFNTQGRTKTGSRFGLVLGALTLFWSAQLLGKEAASAAAAQPAPVAQPPRRVLVISIPDRKLAVTEDGRVLKVYPVAVGAAVTPSPAGVMKVANKVVNPTFYHAGKVIPPGKSNPLGNRWIGLNKKGYGIHGTNAPNSIGLAASHGCFRMRKRDVEELFKLVRVGDIVEIHDERDAAIAAIFRDAEIDDGQVAIVD